MNLLDTLTVAAGEEQLLLRPLPKHAAANQPEHLRRHYALLLAAVLTAQPTVSEPRSRLLRLLLASLKLDDIRGNLFEQASELAPEPLLEAARLIREAGFAHHLALDALVLLRLDAPLGDDAARLAGELATFLGLDEADLAMRARNASDVLGLNMSEDANIDSRNGNKEDDHEGEKGDIAAVPSLLAEIWPAHLPNQLTVEALRGGLQGGIWILDSNLDVDFAWHANNAILCFRNGACLNTFAKEGEIRLADCRLFDAAMDFQGACNITVERCDWRGDYDPAAKRTAINSIGQALNVADCQFSTRNARTIAVLNNGLTLTGSRFECCGHSELDGGAVWHRSPSPDSWYGSEEHEAARKIEHCRFDRCRSARGGAIFVNRLTGVTKCEFVACESRDLHPKNAGDVAVYTTESLSPTAVSECVFRQTSLVIGDAYSGTGAKFVCATQFQNADIYFHHKDYRNQITSDCTFTNGREVEREI